MELWNHKSYPRTGVLSHDQQAFAQTHASAETRGRVSQRFLESRYQILVKKPKVQSGDNTLWEQLQYLLKFVSQFTGFAFGWNWNFFKRYFLTILLSKFSSFWMTSLELWKLGSRRSTGFFSNGKLFDQAALLWQFSHRISHRFQKLLVFYPLQFVEFTLLSTLFLYLWCLFWFLDTWQLRATFPAAEIT